LLSYALSKIDIFTSYSLYKLEAKIIRIKIPKQIGKKRVTWTESILQFKLFLFYVINAGFSFPYSSSKNTLSIFWKSSGSLSCLHIIDVISYIKSDNPFEFFKREYWFMKIKFIATNANKFKHSPRMKYLRFLVLFNSDSGLDLKFSHKTTSKWNSMKYNRKR